MKIGLSVIMPSFLGEYDGCATDREKKFVRAVQSFLDNTLIENELIIIGDNCIRPCITGNWGKSCNKNGCACQCFN